MSAKYSLLFFLLTIPSTQIFAQYTELLNANRPGASQGAFSVGKDVIQIETGFNYGKEKHTLKYTETKGMGVDYAIRYGLLREQFEISLMGEYQSLDIDYVNARTNEKIANFRSNTLGLKYLVFDPYKDQYNKKPNLYSWKANNKFRWFDLVPAVSLYFGVNFDFPNNPLTERESSSLTPKILLSTQNNFPGGFVFVTNIIADWGATSLPSYGYIVTLTHATHRYFSLFVENQGIKNNFYSDQILRGGVATLINYDLQVDLSFSTNFRDTPSKLYGRLGVAYRFDFHEDDEFLYDTVKEGEEKDQTAKLRKAEKKANRDRRKNERRARKLERKQGKQQEKEEN